MRVQPEQAYPQRLERLAGVLQSGDHARHRWTCSKQPDRKVTVTHRLRDRASQVPERKPETLPAAVLGSSSGVRPISTTLTAAPSFSSIGWIPPFAIVVGPLDVPFGMKGCLRSATLSPAPRES